MTRGFFQALMLAGLFCFVGGALQAQVYINGNLSTGANSQSGTAAPAGYTWSEVQNDAGNLTESNTTGGYAASVAAGLSVADDFTVPAGPNWTVTKFTFYSYQTGAAPTPSPFTTLRFRIYDGNPSTGTPTIVFGDLTTNRLTASNDALMYRIFNTVAPAPGTATGTTRKIWTLEADVNISLAPGTYWIEWQTDNTGSTAHFAPPSTVAGVRTVAGYNAQQHDLTANTWTALIDGGNPASAPDVAMDMPFRINYTTSACTGTPDPGNTISSASTVCPTTPFNLSFSNSVAGSGITYQWQSSLDNSSWSDIAGATNPTYSTTHSVSTYYRCAVTCSGGGTGFSASLQVLATPPSGCYCTSTATSSADEDIFNVTVGTLNNTSSCATTAPGVGSVQNRYSNYTSGTGAPAPATLISGGTNPFSVQVGTCGGNFTNSLAIFIDYNGDGSFSAAEKVYASAAGVVGPNTRTGSFFIPSTAVAGPTLMRVICVETGNSANINACGTYTWGETEDYLVTFIPCTPATVATQPSSQTTTCGGSATFTASIAGSFPTYQWQQRAVGQNFWTNVVDGGQFSGATTNTLTITGATSNLNGYQYRINFTGSCSANDFTNAATLTVNPLLATVNPPSATICNGSSQQLSITNSASAVTTANFTSGALGVTIPDDDEFGIIRTISVSGIPANAVITSIDVKFNIAHTWVGDLDINLIAPNGANMNLVGSLNNGTGGNGTANFTNTVISSTGTTIISGAAAPRTGTFAAERRATYGPTNNTQVGAVNWSDLQSTINGDWKIAIADFAAGDEGILQNWDVTITYTSPTLATGVWSPTNGLFTDAGLTTPYTGTAVNTVYAAPTTTTTYSVIVSTQICTTPPLPIPVTVANPIANLVQAANSTICANNSTSFTVSADGNPIEFQWQVSTDGGSTFANVIDGGVYSGATAGTLNLANVPASYNGYQYRCLLNVTACSSTATSNAVTLTVNPNPTVSLAAAPFTALYPGLRTVITATVAPNAASAYQWYLNGSPISGGAGTREVNIDGLGEYTLDVVDVNGCAGSSSASVIITDSLNTSLFIYPNPNTGVFQVRYHDRNKGVASPRFMNVYDSKGARVFSSRFVVNNPFGRMDVDLRKLSKGVYVIDLVDAGGVRMETGKVIIY